MPPTKYEIRLNKSLGWDFDCGDAYPIEGWTNNRIKDTVKLQNIKDSFQQGCFQANSDFSPWVAPIYT